MRDIATARDLPDEIHWSKFTTAHWRKDGRGFYYTGYDAPAADALKAVNSYQKLYFHRLGTPQARDTVIYARHDDADWFVDGVTDDGRYLVISADMATDVRNTVLVQDLLARRRRAAADRAARRKLRSTSETRGRTLYFRTDDAAPRYRIIAIDLAHPEPAHWRPWWPKAKHPRQADPGWAPDHRPLPARMPTVRVLTLHTDGRALGEVELPGLGTPSVSPAKDTDKITYYVYTSFTVPTSIFRLDLRSGKARLWRAPTLAGFRSAALPRPPRCSSPATTAPACPCS